MTEITLNCLLVDFNSDPLGDVFEVRVPDYATVSRILEDVVKRGGYLVDVPIQLLVVWKPPPFFPTSHDGLFEYVKKLHLNTEEKRTAIRLEAAASLRECFLEPPPHNHVHLVVQLQPPHNIVGQKRRREEAEETPVGPLTMYTDTSPHATLASSTVALTSELPKLQSSVTDHILNGCPNKDVPVPPIAFVYPPFGQFLDLIDDPPEEDHYINLARLEAAVNEFASLMCEFYSNETERRSALLPALKAIFDCYRPITLPEIVPSSIGGERLTDGHAIGPAGVIETVLGLLNEIGSTGADPKIQATAYYSQMIKEQKRIGTHQHLYENFPFPALGISIMGPYIGFGAIVLLDEPRFVELTPFLSARSPSGDDCARPMLFRAFWAACVLRSNIHRDTEHVIKHPPVPVRNKNLPRIQKIPAWSLNAATVEQLEFSIQFAPDQGLERLNENRFIYVAKVQDKPVLVKFTRRYCVRLHHFCAERGHAPKLLGYGSVPGGWHVVAMELVKLGDLPEHYASAHWTRWKEDLTSLVAEFHKEGFVHGNLRDVSFIVPAEEPERIMLINYDWGGESGKVFFPTRRLHSDLTGGKKKGNLVITKEHDLRVFTAALEKLKPSSLSASQPPGGQPMDES